MTRLKSAFAMIVPILKPHLPLTDKPDLEQVLSKLEVHKGGFKIDQDSL